MYEVEQKEKKLQEGIKKIINQKKIKNYQKNWRI
jgi:hypothetical protein